MTPQKLELWVNHSAIGKKLIAVSPHQTITECQDSFVAGTPLQLFNNFHFLADGVKLRKYDPIGAQIAQENDKPAQITVELTPFDDRTIKYHFLKTCQVLSNPSKLASLMKLRVESNEAPSLLEQLKTVANEVHFKGIESFGESNLASDQYCFRTQQKKRAFVAILSLSGFNPPPEWCKMKGDLIYIHLKTLEGGDYQITANPGGFFINQSKISSFNPQVSIIHKQVYVSLIDLIRSISDKFSEQLEAALKEDPSELISGATKTFGWLGQFESEHHWNTPKQQSLTMKNILLGVTMEWDESFHLVESMKPHDTQSYYASLEKLYGEFERYAIEGAKLLVDGKISPLNPFDEKSKQIYIHSKIFFSIANETPFNHFQQKGEEAAQSASAINTDIINLERVQRLNLGGIKPLHTVVVSYRGFKVIAQFIIPGILSADQNSCCHYGSIDDGKNIFVSEDFHPWMVKLAKHFHLDPAVRVLDGSGAEKIISISPDIKGIKGNNGHKYILDLLRLSPRDLNFPGPNNETCVLRPNLLERFIQFRNTTTPLSPFNVNIGTEASFIQDQNTAVQEAELREAAQFLRQKAIPQLITALKGQGSSMLADNQSLSSVFHAQGVNMRYLGEVVQHPALNDQPQIVHALRRCILARSFKHLFRMAMRETNIMYLGATLTHLLNCLFAKSKTIASLEEGIIIREEPQETKQSKKKRKKKAKAEPAPTSELQETSSIPVLQSIYMNMKPSQIWTIVCQLAKARFAYKMPANFSEFTEKDFLCTPFQKIVLLRDVCLSLGIFLERRHYNISDIGPSEGNDDLPFQAKNIIDIVAKSKRMKVEIPKSLELLAEGNKVCSTMRLKEAATKFSECSQLLIPLQDTLTLAKIETTLGNACYYNMDFREAAERQLRALRLLRETKADDSAEIVQSFSKLGIYCLALGQFGMATQLLLRSLNLALISFGQTHADLLIGISNLAKAYQQNKQIPDAIKCYQKGLALLIRVYGRRHVNISFCNSAMASLSFETADMKKAIEYQSEAVTVLSELLSEQDSRLMDAKRILKHYLLATSTRGRK